MLWRDCSGETRSSVHRKPVSGEDEAKSSLASQTPHFPQGENAWRRPLEFPHRESIFINFTALEDQFVLSGKKKLLQSYDGNLRIALGAQVGGRHEPPHHQTTFYSSSRSQGTTRAGGSSTDPQLEPRRSDTELRTQRSPDPSLGTSSILPRLQWLLLLKLLTLP